MSCKRIRRIVDEADQAALLPYEAVRHIESCTDCRKFQEERTSLLVLLGSVGRVTAPDNFDALLSARMSRRKVNRAFSWQLPGLYFKMAGAAAMLMAAIFVSQQLFFKPNANNAPVSVASTSTESPVAGALTGPVAASRDARAPIAGRRTEAGNPNGIPSTGPSLLHATPPSRPPVHTVRHAAIQTASPYRDVTSTAVGFVLMRGPVAEREMAVPMVSLGAQALFYVNNDARGIRNARASF
jgi:hypothetical protein